MSLVPNLNLNAAGGADQTDLESVLASRTWLRRQRPFPHVLARDVFTTDFYRDLEAQLRSIFAAGLSEVPDRSRFSRNIPGYDAYAIGFRAQSTTGPNALFLSAAWRDMTSGLFGVERTPYVFAGAHHHPPGSPTGFVHNDYNPVWFVRSRDGRIRSPDPKLCAYRTGQGPLPDSEKIEMVRGVVVMFYLMNDGWRHGDGGETGLFRSAHDSVPDVVCPPINNSLIAFECTPRSFHTYLSNARRPRTSIIMWTHRGIADADSAHGISTLERWRS
jgi:2OG-Fe(II) oxygenase superfamily